MACKTRTKSMQISTRRPVSSWDLPIPSRKTKTKSAAINSDAYAEILFPKKKDGWRHTKPYSTLIFPTSSQGTARILLNWLTSPVFSVAKRLCCDAELPPWSILIGQSDYRESNWPNTRKWCQSKGAGFGSANHNGMLSSTYNFLGRFNVDADCTCSTQHKSTRSHGLNKRFHGNSCCHTISSFQTISRGVNFECRQRNNSCTRTFSKKKYKIQSSPEVRKH